MNHVTFGVGIRGIFVWCMDISISDIVLLYFKLMENERYKEITKDELNKRGLHAYSVELNERISAGEIQSAHIIQGSAGTQLTKYKENLLAERIKSTIFQFVYLEVEIPVKEFSDYISLKFNCNYSSLNKLFRRCTGISIHKYVGMQKIEHVKELLIYTELSLEDIAYKLQYSSEVQLTNQFVKVTGVTPAFFRLLRDSGRNKSKNV